MSNPLEVKSFLIFFPYLIGDITTITGNRTTASSWAIMNQPPLITNKEGMSLTNGKVKHFLGLFNGNYISNDTSGSIRLLDLITNNQMTSSNPFAA